MTNEQITKKTLKDIQNGTITLLGEHTSGGSPSLSSGSVDPVDMIDQVPLPSMSSVIKELDNVLADTPQQAVDTAIGALIKRGLYDECRGSATSSIDDVVVSFLR